MIKLISNKTIIGIRENDNKNYNFFVGQQKVLCLNKRLIEVGIGACVAYSATNVYINPILTELKDIPYIAVGLASISSIAGREGLKFLLLTSSLFQMSPTMLPMHFTLIPTLISLAALSSFIGEGLIIASSGCAFLIGLSFIIKQFGPKYLNTLLSHFNRQQNKVNMGVLEIKNNLEYQLSIFGRDILCLKKLVLQIGTILGFILALSIETSFKGRTEGMLGILIHMTGLLLTHKVLGNKIYLIPMLVITLTAFNPSMYSVYWSACEFLITTFAEGIVLTGACFGAFGLISSLAKKSENQQIKKIGKYLDHLKDKQKIAEHEKYIKEQGLLIQKRREEIKAINNSLNAKPNTHSIEDLRSNSTESDTKQINIPREKIKRKGKNQAANQSASSAGKISTEAPTQIEISGNNCIFTFQKLRGAACENKNVWGVVISDSSNSERYQSWLNNGRIGQNASIRQLKGGGSTFEIGKGMDSRLIGHMYKTEAISDALQGLRQIKDEDISSLVKAIKKNCGEDTSLIIFSREALKHQDISTTSRQKK